MTSNQFFIPPIEPGASRAVIRGEEHRHLSRAARVREGDRVWLFDGRGTRYLAQVESIESDRTDVRVIRREMVDQGMALTLVQAVVAAKKMEFILQKAAELGVSDFQPVETARSLRFPADRSGRKLERWAKIGREAVKQSKGAEAPEVHAPVALKTFVEAEPPAGVRLFLSEHGGRPLASVLIDGDGRPAARPAQCILCVGPEGGWTEGEVKLMAGAGLEPVSLGRRILRTETAAVAATAIISHFWNI